MNPEQAGPKFSLTPKSAPPPEPTTDSERFKAAWTEYISDNPMLDEARREQRRFFRSSAGMGKIGPALVIFLFLFFYVWLVIEAFIANSASSMGVAYIELILITFALPGSIYNSISGERERATWDALVLTRLTTGQIVIGKLAWRFRIILMIVVLSILPIGISLFNTGSSQGPDLGMELIGQMVVVSWGLLLCSFGLWISAITKRSITSLAVIAITLISTLLVIPALYNIFFGILRNEYMGSGMGDPINMVFATFNPFSSLADVLIPQQDYMSRQYLPGSNLGIWQISGYLILSLILMRSTHDWLKRLEVPVKNSR